MDCEAFFETVTARLDGMSDPSRTVSGRQCALDFFHPRTAARLSDSGAVAAFYRSGVVWFEPTRTLKVELRIPEAFDEGVTDALASLDGYEVARTAHRPAATASGEFLSLVHYGVKCDDATDADVAAILEAVNAVLAV